MSMIPESQSILDGLLSHESERMTDREIEFIEDLNKKRDRSLSPRQKEWLDRIWRKVFT